jgi:PAS domain S-box-containing protein
VRRPAWSSEREAPDQAAKGLPARNLARHFTHAALSLGLSAALVGAGHLAAWLGGSMSHRGLSTITMKTNTALCLTLVGAALILLVPPKAGPLRRWAARAGAALALLVGLLTFVENLSGWNFGIDQLLAAETPGALAVANPNQMGTPASLSFTLIGLALLILSRRDHRGMRVAQDLALAVCLIALLSTIGFLYGAEQFYGIVRYTGIAWPTAVALLLMGLGLLCARPAEGLMAQVTADDPGGVSIRRLVPPFVMLPLLLGWLRLAGERAGVFDAATGTGIMMLLFIVLFSALAYRAGRRASRSAQVLRESESKYRNLFENMTEEVHFWRLVRDENGRIQTWRLVDANPPTLKTWGKTLDEIRGKTTDEIFGPGATEHYLPVVQKIMTEGVPHSFEDHFPNLDKHFRFTSVPFGEYFITTGADITRAKKAELALRESEERLRRLGDNLPDSAVYQYVHETDGSVRFLYVSAGIERLNGVSVADVLRDAGTLHRQSPPEYLERLVEAEARSKRELSDFDMEMPMRRPDGELRWMRLRSRPHRLPDGRTVWDGVQTDITERRRAEEALRDSEERFRAVFESSSDCILVWDRQYNYLYANQAAIDHVGTTRDKVIGKNMRDGLGHVPDFMRLWMGRVDRAFATGESFRVEDAVPVGDRLVYSESQVSSIRDAAGSVFAVSVVYRDVTGRRRAEEALRELNATLESKVTERTAALEHRTRQLQKLTLELSQAEERERRRIAVILHEDLQQQIAGAKFHLTVVRSQAGDDRQRAYVDKVDALLTETIEQSRSLSYDLSPAVVHMNDLGDVLAWLAHRVYEQHGLVVHVDVSSDMMLHSEALALFLFRAAQEILFNVVQHAHVREAALRVRRTGRYVCLSVSDQGRGFDPQELKETSGFGLFSIRERTELLGGRMRVKSVKGQGSTLRLVVPDGPKQEDRGQKADDGKQKGEDELPSAAVRPPSSDRALRVLLVDDHDVVREGLAALLREAPDIELVGEAPYGREAIQMAIDLKPDVVIMDVSMPRMSGDQVTRQIKTHLPRTRVIALSMYDEADKKDKMFEAGAEGYILKTVSADELLAAIRGPSPDVS